MLVKIDTYHDGESWCARGISEDIFTQAGTYDELLKNIREAVALHFEEDMEKGGAIEVLVMSELEVRGVS